MPNSNVIEDYPSAAITFDEQKSNPCGRALVVDDDSLLCEVLRRTLLQHHLAHTVDIARSLADASKLLRQHPYDCVLLDLHLPDGDGASLLEAIESKNEHSPATVILSSQDGDCRAKALLNQGAEDYLVKGSIDARAIVRAVGYAQHRHTVRRRLALQNGALTRQAHQDPLTGILNRRGLSVALRTPAPNGTERYGILVDLDDFKRINEVFGHNVGDEIIRVAGQTLRELTRPGDLVCRLGGDEFGVICASTEPQAAMHLAQRLCDGLRQRMSAVIALSHAGHGASASIGVARLDDDTQDGVQFFERCTAVLRTSKANGKGRVAVSHDFADNLSESFVQNKACFIIYAAPIINLGTNSILGYEYTVQSQTIGERAPPFSSSYEGLHWERCALEDRLRAADQPTQSGHAFLPLSVGALRDPSIRRQLQERASPQHPLGLLLHPTPEAADAQEADFDLDRACFRVGIGGIGRGQTPLEMMFALRPDYLRVTSGQPAWSPAATEGRRRLRTLASVARAVGAQVILPVLPPVWMKEDILALGISWGIGSRVQVGHGGHTAVEPAANKEIPRP